MARLRDIKALQKFAAVHASIHNHYNHDRHPTTATYSSRTARPPWPSGVNLQSEKPGLWVLQFLSS